MAKQRRFTVGKTPIDLDKLEAAPAKSRKYVRCAHCSCRFRLKEMSVGSMTFSRCPSCEHSSGYIVPEVDAA